MPKEYRAPSHHYRHVPAPMPTQPQPIAASTRVTSVWTPEEDETLMTARAQGFNWQPIASMHFPTKTANACRKRHERLMERRNNEDWDGVKLDELALAYMEVRKEMWSLLADRLGEKWQTIESKCMEKGIKNLTSAFKTATRKRRGMGSSPCHDSGFGGSDTDAEYELDAGPQYPVGGGSGGPNEASGYVANTPMQMGTAYAVGGSGIPQLHYASGALQPHDQMIMQGQTMDPSNQGRNMSVHAMLSPSPPAH